MITIRCESCGGFGDHGYEEETGCAYTCYACYGTGFIQVREQEAEETLENTDENVSG